MVVIATSTRRFSGRRRQNRRHRMSLSSDQCWCAWIDDRFGLYQRKKAFHQHCQWTAWILNKQQNNEKLQIQTWHNEVWICGCSWMSLVVLRRPLGGTGLNQVNHPIHLQARDATWCGEGALLCSLKEKRQLQNIFETERNKSTTWLQKSRICVSLDAILFLLASAK